MGFTKDSKSSSDDDVDTLSESLSFEYFEEGAFTTVDFYDVSKGFGFVFVGSSNDRAYVHTSKLAEHGVKKLKVGERILCDLARNAKGIYIQRIHEIEPNPSSEIVLCSVINLFPDREYGFVRIDGSSSRDAFFHFSILDSSQKNLLEIGTPLKVEICADASGTGLQVSEIIGMGN